MREPILITEKLKVGYDKRPVVEDIALLAEPGRVLCLIGPNGAGKSTILKTLIRQLPPLSGVILLEGRNLNELQVKELARSSAAVLTGRPEPELMRCEEVVAAGRYPYTGRLGILSQEDKRTVRESMEQVGITSLIGQDFSRISDGQRQRVLLARAICQEPRLLILDEPTSFLDIRHKLEFLTLLRRLVRERQLAVVMSMHELDLAQKFSDTLLCIREGKIDRCGPPEQIFAGDYIMRLYGMEQGSYDGLLAAAEPPAVPGEPEAFVIGGGGSGIALYHRLQRQGVAFAVGVLPENDLDVPTARALAARLFTSPAFEPVSREAVEEARKTLCSCKDVYCPVESFGSMTAENRKLLDCACERGLLRIDAFSNEKQMAERS